jgi:hypothetical protein
MDTYTKKVEYEYVRIRGEEIRLVDLIDFLENIDGYMRYDVNYRRVAEACIEEGFIDTNIRGSWIVTDEDKKEEMLEEAYEAWDN